MRYENKRIRDPILPCLKFFFFCANTDENNHFVDPKGIFDTHRRTNVCGFNVHVQNYLSDGSVTCTRIASFFSSFPQFEIRFFSRPYKNMCGYTVLEKICRPNDISSTCEVWQVYERVFIDVRIKNACCLYIRIIIRSTYYDIIIDNYEAGNSKNVNNYRIIQAVKPNSSSPMSEAVRSRPQHDRRFEIFTSANGQS